MKQTTLTTTPAAGTIADPNLHDDKNPSTALIKVAWIGESVCSPWGEALRDLTLLAEVTTFTTISHVIDWLDQTEATVRWLVLAGTHPNCHSLDEIQALQSAAPVSRIILLSGSWCEGEARTGNIWPGMVRLYWHQWESQLLGQRAGFHNQRIIPWELPLGSTLDDRLAFDSPMFNLSHLSAAVLSNDRQSAEAMMDICLAGNIKSIWLKKDELGRISLVDVILVDANGIHQNVLGQLSDLRRRFPDVVIVLFAGFPRFGEIQIALRSGASCVISKPYDIRDVLSQVSSHASGRLIKHSLMFPQ